VTTFATRSKDSRGFEALNIWIERGVGIVKVSLTSP